MACVVKLVEASATYVYGHPMDQNQKTCWVRMMGPYVREDYCGLCKVVQHGRRKRGEQNGGVTASRVGSLRLLFFASGAWTYVHRVLWKIGVCAFCGEDGWSVMLCCQDRYASSCSIHISNRVWNYGQGLMDKDRVGIRQQLRDTLDMNFLQRLACLSGWFGRLESFR